MERCNSNLEKELLKKKQFNEIELLEFLEQFLNGYQVLYDNNIIHRDLKPENILINPFSFSKNTYKIADFGTGKVYKQNDFIFTQVGTPVYASPETSPSIQDQSLTEMILYHKKEPHFKSRVDIYSLGIILHQIYFGQLPFSTQSPFNIVEFQKNLKATPFKIARPTNKSEPIVELIESMIQYYPDQRISFPDLKQKCLEIKQMYIQPQVSVSNIRFNQLPNQQQPPKVQEPSNSALKFPNQNSFQGLVNMQNQRFPCQHQGFNQNNFLFSRQGPEQPNYFQNQKVFQTGSVNSNTGSNEQPNQLVNQQPQVFQQPINVFQTQIPRYQNSMPYANQNNDIQSYCKFILDYSKQLLYECQGLFSDEAKTILTHLIQTLEQDDKQFPKQLLQEFRMRYQYQNDNKQEYSKEALKFHYCLKIGVMEDPSLAPKYQLNGDIQQLKQYLNLIPQFQMQKNQ